MRNQYSNSVIPGWIANSQICSTELRDCSSGAWSTITVDPTTHRRHPNIPIFWSFSFNKKCAKTALHHFQTDTVQLNQEHYKQLNVQEEMLIKFSNHQKSNEPDYNTQCTKGRHQHGRCIYVRYKIGYLPNNHCQRNKNMISTIDKPMQPWRPTN